MATRMRDQLLAGHEQLRYEPVPQRVRASYDGQLVVDTVSALLVWEPRRVVPSYAVPRDAVHAEVIEGVEQRADPATVPDLLPPGNFDLHLSGGVPLDLRVGTETLDGAGYAFTDADLAGYVLLDWDRFTWTEEATEMVGHPHDPFSRIKVLASDRHVQVSFEGQQLADSRRASLLLETGLPPRWYLPSADVRTDLMEPSRRHTVCAYKGRASYLSLRGSTDGRDLAWCYPEPRHDAVPVAGMICFWAERTDLVLDGEPVPRPQSPFG